jgi:hypothetical protein
MKVITAERAAYIQRRLEDLRDEGTAAVPAIRDFLRSGEDVDFAKMSRGELVGHRTLRQALMDALGAIGGSEAMAVSLEHLERTTEPIELALLARSLEDEEPGVHGEQVMRAVRNALLSAERAPEGSSPDVAPLFDLLRAYGGKQALPLLERSLSEWGEYALITLANLPEGVGISSLTALAGANDAAVDAVLPLQVLAQTAVPYPEAGDALVDLARAGQIPDRAWGAIGEALEGKELRFSGRMFAGTPLAADGPRASEGGAPLWKSYYVEWLNIRYEQDLTSADWSPEQVDQQLALIDSLREATSSSAALEALRQAQVSLLRRRGEGESPLPDG